MNLFHRPLLIAAVLLLSLFQGKVFAGIAVSPQFVTGFLGNAGSGFSPGAMVFSVANNGASPHAWTAVSSAGWMNISPASGTLAAGATVQLHVATNMHATLLQTGLHTGIVTFSDGQTRSVPLLVNGVVATLFDERFEGSALGPQWAVSGTGQVSATIYRSYYFDPVEAHDGQSLLLMQTST